MEKNQLILCLKFPGRMYRESCSSSNPTIPRCILCLQGAVQLPFTLLLLLQTEEKQNNNMQIMFDENFPMFPLGDRGGGVHRLVFELFGHFSSLQLVFLCKAAKQCFFPKSIKQTRIDIKKSIACGTTHHTDNWMPLQGISLPAETGNATDLGSTLVPRGMACPHLNLEVLSQSCMGLKEGSSSPTEAFRVWRLGPRDCTVSDKTNVEGRRRGFQLPVHIMWSVSTGSLAAIIVVSP